MRLETLEEPGKKSNPAHLMSLTHWTYTCIFINFTACPADEALLLTVLHTTSDY